MPSDSELIQLEMPAIAPLGAARVEVRMLCDGVAFKEAGIGAYEVCPR